MSTGLQGTDCEDGAPVSPNDDVIVWLAVPHGLCFSRSDSVLTQGLQPEHNFTKRLPATSLL